MPSKAPSTIALAGAGTDAAAGRPLAEQQRERIHQHRLAGAGLAGEHVEAGAELEGDVGDGGEVADAELGEHPAADPSRLAAGQIAPVQLLPHPAEESVPAEPDQADPMVRAAHVHALARRQRAAGLAVERDQQIVGPARHRLDHDPVGGRHDQRPDGERVRRDRRDDDRLDAGHHDRPAGAQAVGGRAGGRGDDDAVGAVGADVLALDEDVDPHHAGDAALVHRDVVHRELADPVVALAVLDGGLQRLAPLDHVAAGHQRVERGVEGVAGGGGEEPDPAEVDAEDGDLAAAAAGGRRGAACRRRRR